MNAYPRKPCIGRDSVPDGGCPLGHYLAGLPVIVRFVALDLAHVLMAGATAGMARSAIFGLAVDGATPRVNACASALTACSGL